MNAPEAYVRFDPSVFGNDGEVNSAESETFLRHYMDEYAAFVTRVLTANAPGHIGDEDPDSRK